MELKRLANNIPNRKLQVFEQCSLEVWSVSRLVTSQRRRRLPNGGGRQPGGIIQILCGFQSSETRHTTLTLLSRRGLMRVRSFANTNRKQPDFSRRLRLSWRVAACVDICTSCLRGSVCDKRRSACTELKLHQMPKDLNALTAAVP